jgi:cobalt-zinc-cadmium efflux system protein
MAEGHRTSADLLRSQRRALWIALVINGAYVVVEIAGGIAFNSLALLADAGHMLSDVVALGIALLAQSLASRPASARHTFGMQRAEVLGALANGATLIAVVGWIVVEGVRRISDPEPVAGGGLLLVALLGLVLNLVSATVLARARGRSLNLRAAHLHMVSDAAGSAAVIVAAVAVVLWDATFVDPLASFVIGGLILSATWGLLRDAVHVLMEGAPRDVDANEVERELAAQSGVVSVHHLHLWNLASDTPALSAHVVLVSEDSLHEAQERSDQLKMLLHNRFGIEHATLELECHPCVEVAPRS